MFFFWPTLNDRTLSGERDAARRERRLSRLEDRVNEFMASRATAGGVAVERALSQRQLIFRRVAKAPRQTIAPRARDQHHPGPAPVSH